MTDPIVGRVRLARAGTATLASVGLSLAAHRLGGGMVPSALGLVTLVLPVAALSLGLTGRRVSLPLLSVLFGATEVVLHFAFEAMAGGAPAGHAMSVSPAMTLGHALAAAVLVAVLHRGEQTLWRVWEWLAPRLPYDAPPTRADQAAVGSPPPRTPLAGPVLLLRLRGPPATPGAARASRELARPA